MSGESARARIADLAVGQWGLLTTAQAAERGVSRMLLSRMSSAGELERMAHGVYATPSAGGTRLAETRALWLSLDPARTVEERLADLPASGAISHDSAARLHGAGVQSGGTLHVTFDRRYRTARPELHPHVARLRPDEVVLVEGLPVTTLARTVRDLLAEHTDLSHVADVVASALHDGRISSDEVVSAALGRGGGYGMTDEDLVARIEHMTATAAPVPGRLEVDGLFVELLAEKLRDYGRLLADQEALTGHLGDLRWIGAQLAELLDASAALPTISVPRDVLPSSVADSVAAVSDRIGELLAATVQGREEEDTGV